MSPAGDNRKRVNLALQGGGAHGAFTWGVLDRLLEDGRLDFEGVSGTSAGAMNAVVLADGITRGGAQAARERLEAFWKGVSRNGSPAGPAQPALDMFLRFWNIPAFPTGELTALFGRFASPYAFNPLNINPLEDLIARLVDFDRVRACDRLKLFVSATAVETGKIRVFTDGEIDARAVMASACLPLLFQAVEIDGIHYWDGGYMGNPALFPFFTETDCEDIVLVQINPVERAGVPKSAHEIMERINEVTFNASLLREFRAIDFVNRMIDEHRLDTSRYRRNRLHRIDATDAFAGLSSATKFDASWRFFTALRDIGRTAAQEFLDAHFDDIGVRATLDLRAAFS